MSYEETANIPIQLKQTPKNIDDFINTYDHIDYCEIIILADCTIVEAQPSHAARMIEIFKEMHGATYEEIIRQAEKTKMSIIEFLTYATHSVAVWYCGYAGVPSDEQMQVLEKLAHYQKIKEVKQIQI